VMKRIKKIGVLVALGLVAGLVQANSQSDQSREGVHSVSLSWAAPGSRTDGSAVHSGDIVGYRIYIGERSGTYTEAVEIEGPQVTEYTVRGLDAGVYRFSVTALDVFGNESALSDELLYRVR